MRQRFNTCTNYKPMASASIGRRNEASRPVQARPAEKQTCTNRRTSHGEREPRKLVLCKVSRFLSERRTIVVSLNTRKSFKKYRITKVAGVCRAIVPQRAELRCPRLPHALIARSRRDLAIRVLHALTAIGPARQTAAVPTTKVVGVCPATMRQRAELR